MKQITLANLTAVVARINRMTGSPAAPYARDASGKLTAQIGAYCLDECYGGVSLHRIVNLGGGVSDVLSIGHVPKRTTYRSGPCIRQCSPTSPVSMPVQRSIERGGSHERLYHRIA
jgi:hypothetical protein